MDIMFRLVTFAFLVMVSFLILSFVDSILVFSLLWYANPPGKFINKYMP